MILHSNPALWSWAWLSWALRASICSCKTGFSSMAFAIATRSWTKFATWGDIELLRSSEGLFLHSVKRGEDIGDICCCLQRLAISCYRLMRPVTHLRL